MTEDDWDREDAEDYLDTCPLGLKCSEMGEGLIGSGFCCNLETCWEWVSAWELPYRYDHLQKTLFISHDEWGNLDFEILRNEAIEYGFMRPERIPQPGDDDIPF